MLLLLFFFSVVFHWLIAFIRVFSLHCNACAGHAVNEGNLLTYLLFCVILCTEVVHSHKHT